MIGFRLSVPHSSIEGASHEVLRTPRTSDYETELRHECQNASPGWRPGQSVGRLAPQASRACGSTCLAQPLLCRAGRATRYHPYVRAVVRRRRGSIRNGLLAPRETRACGSTCLAQPLLCRAGRATRYHPYVRAVVRRRRGSIRNGLLAPRETRACGSIPGRPQGRMRFAHQALDSNPSHRRGF